MTTPLPHPSPPATAPPAEAIRTVALNKLIDDRPVLVDIELTVATGCFIALLGANGAGKSTLLKILATLTPPTSGTFSLFGKPAHRSGVAIRRRLGLVSHQSLLYRDLSIRQNLEFFARLYAVPNPKTKAQALLQAIGLEDRADDPVKAMSRGMAQRVAIARALVHDPDLLLADEPFDGLDAPSTAVIEQLLQGLHQAGKTLLLVNHDIGQSLRLAERAVVLREGQVVIDAPAGDLDRGDVLREMERA